MDYETDIDNSIDPLAMSVDAILREYSTGAFAYGPEPAREAPAPEYEPEYEPEYMEPEPKPEPEPELELEDQLTLDLDDTDKFEPLARPAPAQQRDRKLKVVYDARAAGLEDSGDYAAGHYAPLPAEEEEPGSGARQKDVPQESARDRFLRPLINLLAVAALKRERRAEADESPEPEPEEPEVSLKKAAKHYARQIRPLRLRGRLAAGLCAVLCYIAMGRDWGFPLPGALGSSPAMGALVCLILMICVMVLGLDVITAGSMALLRLRPGPESLIVLSCLFSAIDAVAVAAGGKGGAALPFCAVSALSVAFAILSSRLTCSGLSAGFKTAAQAAAPYAVTTEADIREGAQAMFKSKKGTAGFVRRSEAADMAESAIRLFAPFLIAAALVLALLAAISGGGIQNFLHIFSGILACTAAFSGLLAFAMPFCVTARRLRHSGAACAGSEGCAAIGRSRGVVVTDTDLFPAGTVSIESIRLLEGAYNEKIISYTGSVLAASGCGLSGVFVDLMSRNGYALHKVTDFGSHEGGGLSARVGGEQVYVGTAGFMHLMGIMVPHSVAGRNIVYSAISGVVSGAFNIKYIATASVQDALATLLHSRGDPVFAVRDFNISPLLVKERFRMPAEKFDFPSFEERYRLSGVEPAENSPVVAVISREGLGPLAELSDRGRRLYRAGRAGVILSMFFTILGMILMALLFRAGSFETATSAYLFSYMFFTGVVPVLVLSFGLRR